jgi:CheY-like chemotaxis protein
VTDRRARVLLVEDDDSLRDTLVEVLTEEGHELRSAPNGAIALLQLRGWDADVIILDIMTPVMDAFEFRRRQLAQEVAPEARVLILSAGRELQRAAERISADAWLPKPFRLVDVIETVERLAGDTAA